MWKRIWQGIIAAQEARAARVTQEIKDGHYHRWL